MSNEFNKINMDGIFVNSNFIQDNPQVISFSDSAKPKNPDQNDGGGSLVINLDKLSQVIIKPKNPDFDDGSGGPMIIREDKLQQIITKPKNPDCDDGSGGPMIINEDKLSDTIIKPKNPDSDDGSYGFAFLTGNPNLDMWGPRPEWFADDNPNDSTEKIDDEDVSASDDTDDDSTEEYPDPVTPDPNYEEPEPASFKVDNEDGTWTKWKEVYDEDGNLIGFEEVGTGSWDEDQKPSDQSSDTSQNNTYTNDLNGTTEIPTESDYEQPQSQQQEQQPKDDNIEIRNNLFNETENRFTDNPNLGSQVTDNLLPNETQKKGLTDNVVDKLANSSLGDYLDRELIKILVDFVVEELWIGNLSELPAGDRPEKIIEYLGEIARLKWKEQLKWLAKNAGKSITLILFNYKIWKYVFSKMPEFLKEVRDWYVEGLPDQEENNSQPDSEDENDGGYDNE